jgi:hypothetical protein
METTMTAAPSIADERHAGVWTLAEKSPRSGFVYEGREDNEIAGQTKTAAIGPHLLLKLRVWQPPHIVG